MGRECGGTDVAKRRRTKKNAERGGFEPFEVEIFGRGTQCRILGDVADALGLQFSVGGPRGKLKVRLDVTSIPYLLLGRFF